MVFRIAYRCAYYPQFDHEHVRQRTQDEWDAYQFCGAVKRGEIHGYCHSKDPRHRIDENNVLLARKLFGKFAIEMMNANWPTAQRIVPVPSKDSWNSNPFRTLTMCRAMIADVAAGWVSPMIRFTEERVRASEGGARGYDASYPYLIATAEPGVQRVVLVDDIVTSGGTLLAARRRLVEAGMDVVGAVVAGRTTAALPDPWQSGFIDVDDEATHLP